MSTRSVIGTIDESGAFRGRYIHWGGMPTERGPVLAELIATFDGGLAQLLKVLTVDHHGWSKLGVTVEGETVSIGQPYTDQPDEWWEGVLGQSGDVEEWGWFFTSTDPTTAELVVVEGGDVPTEVARIKVTELHTATEQDWTKVECGVHFERCSHYAWFHFPEQVARESRIGTAAYLGRQPLTARDAVAAVYRGVRYELTGSGRTGGYTWRAGQPKGRQGVWYASGRNAQGTEVEIPLYWTKSLKPYQGVTLIYPELITTPVRA